MLLIFAGGLLGCDTLDHPVPRDCPAVAEPAVVVEVENADTGMPEAEDAVGILEEGAFRDTMEVADRDSEGTPLALAGAYERVGTYRIQIEKSGFEDWTRSGVEVEAGECGPRTERLTAALEPVAE